MSEEKNAGPACSLQSRPNDEASPLSSFKKVDLPGVRKLIDGKAPVVIIIEAEWCGDCRNQMRNLPKFEEALAAAGIDLYLFTAEGPFYDHFITPEHKEFVMRICATPVGSPIYGDRISQDDSSSVMAKRGREGYPAIFFISNGAVQLWSIEDVSEKQLEKTAKEILAIGNT